MTYFELFSLDADFAVDLDDLNRRYFALQQQCHPDRFHARPEAERLAALQKSMELNEAYETLKSPLKRAEYLLSLHGILVNSKADNIKPEQALLIENMELREQLQEATNDEALRSLADSAIAQKNQALEKFATLYSENALESAAQQVIRLRYAMKLAEEVAAKHKYSHAHVT